MWTAFLLTFAINNTSGLTTHIAPNNNLGFSVGDYFSDLEPEDIEMLHKVAHKDVSNSYTWSEPDRAPNTDDCWFFTETCQLDKVHHIFYLPLREHPGHYYEVTFSYNWKIIKIFNTYLKG